MGEDTLEFKEKNNIWDHVNSFGIVLCKMYKKEWSWVNNPDCKYVDLRVDMRNGGCIIKNRHGKRILPEDLAFQYDYKKGGLK